MQSIAQKSIAQNGNKRSLIRLLIGSPLETAQAPHQSIGKFIGLAVFASDALSSVAYATEEILLVLAMAGTAYFWLSMPIAGAIAGLLIILTISYRQIIFAYPNGGGAYIVARDNLGELPAQMAGAALLTDYILTVSVSISSGVAQITSAFPALIPFRVEIAVLMIVFMTIVNLRGVKESGRAFAIPSYFFITMMLLMLGLGFWKLAQGTLGHVTYVETVTPAIQPLTMFLVLRAFASGCTAVTGVEAISNGITAFKEPRTRNAANTLVWMSAILLTMFLGITYLSVQISAVPAHEETVISQLARTIYGEGPLYLLILASTTIILLMAANTSYAGFPRLAALQAADGFLPRQLTIRGSRLVFSWGIVMLAVFSSLLIVLFNAQVSALIPLYAIGVFLSFTLSQIGMVIRWRRISQLKPDEQVTSHGVELRFDPHWRIKQFINGTGAVVAGIVTVVFAIAKFSDGAWVVVILIPALVGVFFRIHSHYRYVAHELSLASMKLSPRVRPMRTILLVDDVHASTVRMVSFAKSLGCSWEAIHVATREEKTASVIRKWHERIGENNLKILDSPYRSLTQPIREYVEKIRAEEPEGFIHIIMGHIVMASFWEQALHQNSSFVIRMALQDLPRIAITDISYQFHPTLSILPTSNGLNGTEPSAAATADLIAGGELIPMESETTNHCDGE